MNPSSDDRNIFTRKPTSKFPRVQRYLLVCTISGALLLQPLAPGSLFSMSGPVPATAAAAATSVDTRLDATGSNIITSGAKRTDYRWTSVRNGKTVSSGVHVIAVDLTNPYISLNTISGNDNHLTKRESVETMVDKTGAVAGVNADFFDTSAGTEGVPFGTQITSGELVTSPMRLEGMYAFGITKDRTPLIDKFEFAGSVTAEDGSPFPLAGLNRSSYTAETGQTGPSHVNSLYIYNDAWTAAERPAATRSMTTPTEALVIDGVVTQIADNSTLPLQPPANGYILRGHGTAAQYIRDHLPVGAKVNADYHLTSGTSGRTFEPSDFQMMVGGHTILVNEGQPSSFSRSVAGIDGSSGRARTGVGYAKDGKTVYLVTVEEGGDNAGMTLNEFQRLLVSLDVWKAVDLDGGGSTTMIDRPLGEFDTELTHPTTYGSTQRQVANAVGVFTNAPQGTLKGITASGRGKLFIGEQAIYSLNAYDTHYNPIDPAGLSPKWSVGNPGIVTIANGTITALKPGSTTVTVRAGSGSDEQPIEVIGADAIQSMSIEADSTALAPGASINVQATVKLKDGGQYTVPASSLKWEFDGFTASAGNGAITIGSVSNGADIGYAIARYDGFSALLTLTAGQGQEQSWEDFENPAYAVSFKGSKAAVTGSAGIVAGLPERQASRGLRLTYDFTQDTGIKAAYALLGDSGKAVPGSPTGMAVDVYGDGGMNMLRAQVTDAAGKTYMVELAKSIDWTGWKRVTADFGSYGMKFPVTVKSLYVATAAEGQDERAKTGEVSFDNAAMLVVPDPASAGSANTTVTLAVGKKTAYVNGAAVKLDVAPIVLSGTTYLPLRFVSDTMKGKIGYDNQAKRASVLRAGKLLEMTLGSKQFVLNGERKAAEVAPIVRGGRTLVPVRLVSEQLGLKVGWDQKTRTITIS